MTRPLIALFPIVIVTALSAFPGAQDVCRVPAPPPSRQPNIFTPAQEAELGAAIVDRYTPVLRVIDDASLTRELRRIGRRVAAHLPAAAALEVEFHLSDMPEVNAFVLPGGRIYVSRKLIGFVRSEDELAGVIGHELGHLVARQQTIEITRQLREVLRVTTVGDRDDLFEKYNRLMDNWARKPGVFQTGSHEDREQIEADRLGLQLMAAAGYDTQAFAGFYDRVAETQGRTGSVVSRLFGTTSPESRRLREILRATDPNAAPCAGPRVEPDRQPFAAWQSSVLAWRGGGRTERLERVVSRGVLSDPLRGELTHLRFSPDGRYLLAQDASGVSVLTRDPFVAIFRIDRNGGEPAQFSPDSQHVLWHSRNLRIERWSLADRRMVEAHDVVLRDTCRASALAPDGRTVACVDGDGDLLLVEAATGNRVHEEKAFHVLSTFQLLLSLYYGIDPSGPSPVTLRFSPDGRFFAAGYVSGTLVYDMTARAVLPLRPDASRLLRRSFAFTAGDRVIGVSPGDASKSGVIQLPGGAVVDPVPLISGAMASPSQPGFLLVRPFQKFEVGLLDLSTRTFTKGHAMPAFDVLGDVFAAERGTGDVGLYRTNDNGLIAAATLPTAPLQHVYAVAVSPDFRWLALSDRSRGAVWDLSSGTRLGQVRGFAGAHVETDGSLFVDFRSAAGAPRSLMRLDPIRNEMATIADPRDALATQHGPWFVVTRPLPENVVIPDGVEYEVRDVRTGTTLWSRRFSKDPPSVWIGAAGNVGDALVLGWRGETQAARDRIREDRHLRDRVKAHELQGDALLEVVQADTGEVRGRMVVETGKGSFDIRNVFALGDWVVVSDTIDRVLVYSLATGELKGHAFGGSPAASVTGRRLAVENGPGRLTVHELDTMRRLADFTFEHPVVFKTFNADGTLLFVLTADHKTFVLQP